MYTDTQVLIPNDDAFAKTMAMAEEAAFGASTWHDMLRIPHLPNLLRFHLLPGTHTLNTLAEQHTLTTVMGIHLTPHLHQPEALPHSAQVNALPHRGVAARMRDIRPHARKGS